MSAIGDYIHLTSRGYDYGILPKIARGFAETQIQQKDAISAFVEQRQKLDEMVAARGNVRESLDIQKGIYTFLNFLNSQNQEDRDFISKIVERIEKELKIEIDTRCLDIKNFEQGTPERNTHDLQKIIKSIQGTQSSDGQLQQRSYIIAKTARSLVESFKEFDQNLTNGILDIKLIKESYNTISDILNIGRLLIQEIDKKYSNEKERSHLFIQDFSGMTPTSYYKKEAFYITDPKTGAKISLITFAQELDKILRPFSFNRNEKRGKIPELMFAAGSAWHHQGCKKKVDKIMEEAMSKNIWRGSLKTNTTYITGKFIPGFEQQKLEGYKTITFDDKSSIVVKTGGGSDDKVDVMFYYDTDTSPAALSIKNYSLHTVQTEGFSGVKGAPFLSLLQLFDVNFVNHWINNTILHARWDNHYKPDQRGKYLQQAHQLMRYGLVVYGALGGYIKTDMGSMTTNNQKQVDYLVWNNNSSTKVNDIRVYPFSYLLKDCYSKLNSPSGWIDETGNSDYGFFSTKSWSTIKFLKMVSNSTSAPSAQAQLRILALLAKMHEIKISTHIFIS